MANLSGSTRVATTSSCSQMVLENVDETIRKLSDDPSGFVASSGSVKADNSIIRSFAPKGLEESFKQLHSILFPCLCRREEDDTTTVSAFLMGPRGSGKSLLLERCLSACRHQHPEAKFRKVLVHGIVSRGEDVPSVVYEIIRQLSEVAYQETQSSLDGADQPAGISTTCTPSKRSKQRDKHLLRLRKSAFTSNLSLLESTFKIAEVDRIPILLILDELDSFTDEGERQLLLYHLLDRVATPGSNICLVGITSSFATLSLLEKRIRSRAEGTSKVVYVRPPATYNDLLEVMKFKLDGCTLQDDIIDLFSTKGTGGNDDNEMRTRIASTLMREFRLGKDFRWFSRLLLSALSLYRYDVMMASRSDSVPSFQCEHVIEALEMMEASMSDDLTASVTQHSNLCMIDGTALDPRMQALLDLSSGEVALVFSARRLLRREAHREEIKIPLTLERMFQEYQSFHRGAKKQNNTLLPAAIRLLERGILVPSMDHSGSGPLQYHVAYLHKTLDPSSLSRMPLHMPIEIHRELGEALNRNLLDCSTALKEWGKRTN